MPITYQIDRAAGLIRTICSGNVTIDDVRDHFHQLVLDPDRPEILDVFLDMRDMTSSPSAAEIREAGNTIARLPANVRFGALAIVSQRDALFGLSRMFSVFVERYFRVINAFRSAAKAEEWLEEQRTQPVISKTVAERRRSAH